MSDLLLKHLKTISKIDNVPNGWEYERIGGKCSLGRGRVISQIEIHEKPGPYPVYSSQTTNEGCMGHLATNDFDGEYATWTTDGANAGTVFYRNGKFNCTNVCGTIQPKVSKSVDLKFLVYHLNRISKCYVSYHGNPKLMNDVMANIAITFPPYKEQRAIAFILGSVDEAIRQTEAVIAKLQQVKAGMLHALLTCGLDVNGELRDPIRHPEQFKDSPLGKIPTKWEVISLSSITDFVTSGSRGWAQFYASDGPLFLRIGNLTREHINLHLDDIVHVHPPRGAEGARTQVMSGDVLISITADLGIVGCVSEKISEAFVNQHIALVRLNKEVNPRWVAHYLASPSYQHRFGLLNDAGAKAGMNLTSVGNLQLSIPASLFEQIKIVQCLDEVDGRVETEKANLQKLILLKQGLMHDLLTGTIRVPASLPEATS